MAGDGLPKGSGARFGMVLVNYNGASTLNGAIRSAVLSGLPQSQVVLVDNGSVDGSVEVAVAEFPGMQVVRNGCNAGFAKAVNRGLEGLSTEFVLLLNNDAEMDPEALEAFSDCFDQDATVGIAGGQLRYPNGRLQSAFSSLPSLREEIIPMNFLKWTQPERYLRVTDATETRIVESVFGACLAVRMAAIRQVGALDEAFFFYFEEVEWCQRMQRHGWQVKYVPAARATHLLGHTANRFRGGARIELQRSKLLYFRKSSSALGYGVLSATLVLRSAVNALSGLLGCIGTLFLQKKLVGKTKTYGYVFLWHLLLRPAGWGLPGKCPSGSRLDRAA